MKKGVLLTIVFLSVLLSIQLIFAATNTSSNVTVAVTTTADENSQVDLAYTCLENKIDDRTCDKLSLSEKIFSVMATGKCISELMKESKDDKCWPKGGCTVKDTAQAMMALKRVGYDTDLAQEWILTQNQSTKDLQWFLLIDGTAAMKCSIKYSDTTYNIDLREDKTLSSGAGSCLSADYNNYWLTISPECYSEKFEISCDTSFQTNLVYKKALSSVFYVSEKTNSGPAAGTTEERVYSECFAKEGECDYESSLWAVYSLVSTNSYDIGPFWPYLQTMAEDNDKILSEGILNYVSDSATLKASLLKKQEADGYWDVSGDKFYDTAFALMPFAEDFSEKSKSIKWLLTPGVQDKDGCWKGNLLNTAFLLYSIWPKAITPISGPSTVDCIGSKNFCLSPIDCKNAGGTTLASTYSCASGNSICCSKNIVLKTCTELKGQICNSNQLCQGGSPESALGINTGETCCVGGTCTAIEEQTECEISGGSCALATFGCASNEEESGSACGESNKICCIKKTNTTTTSSNLWIWIVLLILLIIIVALAIVYRDKLRPYWLQFTSKFNKGGNSAQRRGPGLPSMPSNTLPVRTPMTRRLIPQAPQPQNRQIPPQGMPQRPQSQPNEMDEVLKKLKDMSK